MKFNYVKLNYIVEFNVSSAFERLYLAVEHGELLGLGLGFRVQGLGVRVFNYKVLY